MYKHYVDRMMRYYVDMYLSEFIGDGYHGCTHLRNCAQWGVSLQARASSIPRNDSAELSSKRKNYQLKHNKISIHQYINE